MSNYYDVPRVSPALNLAEADLMIVVLETALRAIIARADGRWDDPDLMKVGPLTTVGNDCKFIALQALRELT